MSQLQEDNVTLINPQIPSSRMRIKGFAIARPGLVILELLLTLSRQGCIIITVIGVFYVTFRQVRHPLMLHSELSSSISM